MIIREFDKETFTMFYSKNKYSVQKIKDIKKLIVTDDYLEFYNEELGTIRIENDGKNSAIIKSNEPTETIKLIDSLKLKKLAFWYQADVVETRCAIYNGFSISETYNTLIMVNTKGFIRIAWGGRNVEIAKNS